MRRLLCVRLLYHENKRGDARAIASPLFPFWNLLDPDSTPGLALVLLQPGHALKSGRIGLIGRPACYGRSVRIEPAIRGGQLVS